MEEPMKRKGGVQVAEALADLPCPVQSLQRYNLDRTLEAQNVLAFQAVSLRQVADDLQNDINQMTVDVQTIKMTRVLGYSLSMVMLRALATELMLKALSFKKTGQYRKDRNGHDLLILFNDLDSETKKIVGAQESSQEIASLQQILEKHKDDFIEWRYIAEKENGTPVDFLDLDKALLVLITVYSHKDFLKSCQDNGGANLANKPQT